MKLVETSKFPQFKQMFFNQAQELDIDGPADERFDETVPEAALEAAEAGVSSPLSGLP